MFPILLFLTLSACNPTAKAPVPGTLPSTGPVIATVNGENITEGTIDAILTQFPPSKVEEIKKTGGIDQIKEQLILTEALYQKAIQEKEVVNIMLTNFKAPSVGTAIENRNCNMKNGTTIFGIGDYFGFLSTA